MRRKKLICAILGICASVLLTGAVLERQEVKAAVKLEEAQESLSKEVFRFHVLANSDSKEDQELKLKVRDAILAYMKTEMPQDNPSAESTEKWVCAHLSELEEQAEKVIREEGCTYGATAQVRKTYFPDRQYGEILFPKGYYNALRIKLGEAGGHNWWCVLYPNLCFTDAVCMKVDEKGQQELQNVLSEDEYETVTATSDFKIKSFFFERFWGEN